jgi:nitrogen fixation/metabolism regulation signal transduction histidine kinase
MTTSAHTQEICLQVFAKASAAITHEIKNTLSIINENAGLLEDLAAMADDDAGIPSGHLLSATATIMKQVARSNVIMKNLNTFAHSADIPFTTVNLETTLQLLIALTDRQAAMKKAAVSAACPPDLVVHTRVFTFESLIYLALRRIYDVIASQSTLQLEAARDNSDIVISFSATGQPLPVLGAASDDEAALAGDIGATLAGEQNRYVIRLPAVSKDT